MNPSFNKTILPNGLRVVTETHPGARTQNMGMFIDLGTRDELPGMDGAAHFIEHMVFKGTHSRNAYELAKCIEAVGGDINAFTSREHTCFHLNVLAEDMELGIDVLCDLTGQAVFDADDFEKERNVIIQEIDMSGEDLEEAAFDFYFEEAFKSHALRRPILGTKESLMAMSRDQLFEFYTKEYCGSNLILSVVGPSTHEQVIESLMKFESRLSGTPAVKQRTKPEHKDFRSYRKRPSEQVHLLLGFESSSFSNDLRFESYIVNALLGGGMTSRLYQKVREDEGLVYSIYSFLHSYVDVGVIQLYAGTAEKNAPRVLELIQSEMLNLIEKGISKEDLNMFKQQVRGQILIGADDYESRMNSLGVNELVFGEYRSVNSVISEIEKITESSVNEYLATYLKGKKPGFMMVGGLEPDKATSIMKSYN